MKQYDFSACRSMCVLIAVLLFLCAPRAKAQATCTSTWTTDGTNTPFDICSARFTGDACIYTSSEICYGTISSVRYYVTNRFGSTTFPIKIYMKTTPSGTFSSGSTYSSMLSGATLVFSNAAQGWPAVGWQTFTLSTPFTYTTGNLVVIGEADWNAVPACGTAPVFGYGTKTASDQYWNAASMASLLSSTGTIDQYRPGMTIAGAIALPIELETFAGSAIDRGRIMLSWTTASEVNNDYYAVERSADGMTFEEIARVKGAGNSSAQLDYHSMDGQPLAGINYYRLRQVDLNHAYNYSRIISIEPGEEGAALDNPHPNPTGGNFGFDFYAPVAGRLHIVACDYSGRILMEESRELTQGKSPVEMPLDGLAPGMYLVKVSFDKTGFSSINKVIKN